MTSLSKDGRHPLARAPATLCAIHAIELYLNAFLMHRGSSAAEIRGHFHDLAARSVLAAERGLVLRRRTAEHLAKMTRDREYLVSRYGPEGIAALSEMTRLVATLDELAKKVGRAVGLAADEPAMLLAARPAVKDAPLWTELILQAAQG